MVLLIVFAKIGNYFITCKISPYNSIITANSLQKIPLRTADGSLFIIKSQLYAL